MWIWIDALSINQNDSSERNHQVQQMGLIFSRAKNVTSWLGDERHIARFLLHVRRRAIHEDHTQDSRKAVLERPGQPPGFHYFCVAEYWNRAWITQEVALARRITLMAANIELDGSLYPVLSEWGEGYLARLEHLRPKNTAKWKGRSLVYLMDKFKLKESRIRRDRVYSLLALCGDGKDLQVNYDATDQRHPAMLQAVILLVHRQHCCIHPAAASSRSGRYRLELWVTTFCSNDTARPLKNNL